MFNLSNQRSLQQATALAQALHPSDHAVREEDEQQQQAAHAVNSKQTDIALSPTTSHAERLCCSRPLSNCLFRNASINTNVVNSSTSNDVDHGEGVHMNHQERLQEALSDRCLCRDILTRFNLKAPEQGDGHMTKGALIVGAGTGISCPRPAGARAGSPAAAARL